MRLPHLQPEARRQRALVRGKKGEASCGNLGLDHFLGCALWLHSPSGFTGWDCSVKQLGNTSGSRSKKTELQATVRLGASTIAAALGPVVAQFSSGPFPLKLFIGFLWSSGKIKMFYIDKCLASIVEYIQGNRSCSCCVHEFHELDQPFTQLNCSTSQSVHVLSR